MGLHAYWLASRKLSVSGLRVGGLSRAGVNKNGGVLIS